MNKMIGALAAVVILLIIIIGAAVYRFLAPCVYHIQITQQINTGEGAVDFEGAPPHKYMLSC